MLVPMGFDLNRLVAIQMLDPFEILRTAEKAVVKMQVNLLQILTGYEQRNRYDVFVLSNGMTIRLFRCKEESGWCMRQCCPTHARAFNMKVNFVANNIGQIDDNFTAPIAIINRPWACTCMCLGRPEMTVTWNLGGQARTIGTVFDPFTCCNPQLNIYNAEGRELLRFVGNCCQCGFHCKCYKVEIDMYRPGNDIPCGALIKTEKFSSCITNADTFNIFFPKDSSPEEKMLIIAATLMMDYQHFEDNGKRHQNSLN